MASDLQKRVRRLEYLVATAIAGGGGGGSGWLLGGNTVAAIKALGTLTNFAFNIITNNTVVAQFDTSGDFVPAADATGQVGTNALRWNVIRGKTITSGDVELQSEDGSAHWTLKEQPDRILAKNQITGEVRELLMGPVLDPKDHPTEPFAKSRAPVAVKLEAATENALALAHDHRVAVTLAVQAALADLQAGNSEAAQAALNQLVADHHNVTDICADHYFALAHSDEENNHRASTLDAHVRSAGELLDQLGTAVHDEAEARQAREAQEVQARLEAEQAKARAEQEAFEAQRAAEIEELRVKAEAEAAAQAQAEAAALAQAPTEPPITIDEPAEPGESGKGSPAT